MITYVVGIYKICLMLRSPTDHNGGPLEGTLALYTYPHNIQLSMD